MVVTIEENPCISPNHRLFTIHIDNTHTIRTTVTSHHSVVTGWITHTLHVNHHLYHTNRLVIGLAIRPTPSSINNIPPATIQLCVNNSCLIYHLRHATNSPTVLHDLLADPGITFASLWPRPNMITPLRASHPSFFFLNNMPVDVRLFFRDCRGNPLNDARIHEIAAEVLGFDIQPELLDVEYSDWEGMELTAAQIAHACVDAFVPYTVAMRARVWKSNRNLFFFYLLLANILIILIILSFLGH